MKTTTYQRRMLREHASVIRSLSGTQSKPGPTSSLTVTSELSTHGLRSMRIFSVTTLLLLLQVLVIEKGFSQVWSKHEAGTDDDSYVVNRDKSNDYTYLRLQTSTNQGWAMVNKSGLSWRYSSTNPTGEWYHGIQDDASIRMMLTTGGNLGIGTTSPAEKLDVNGKGIFRNSSANYLHLGHGGGNSFLNHHGAGNLDFRYEGTNQMRLTQQGNLGIGTTAPTEKLTVQGSIYSSGNIYSNGNVGIGTNSPSEKLEVAGKGIFRNSSANYLYLGHGGANSFLDHHGAGNLDFRYEATNLMTLTQNGNLGIGTASPSEKLAVEGNISSSGNIYSNGKVGIGTTAPTEKLEVTGNIKADGVVLNIGTFPDYVFADGYELMPLEELETYLHTNRHLPGMPAETEVVEKGMDLGWINTLLVEKVEELTLHTINQEKKIDALQAQLLEMKATLDGRVKNQ